MSLEDDRLTKIHHRWPAREAFLAMEWSEAEPGDARCQHR
jgi:hypothetical protein